MVERFSEFVSPAESRKLTRLKHVSNAQVRTYAGGVRAEIVTTHAVEGTIVDGSIGVRGVCRPTDTTEMIGIANPGESTSIRVTTVRTVRTAAKGTVMTRISLTKEAVFEAGCTEVRGPGVATLGVKIIGAARFGTAKQNSAIWLTTSRRWIE
jgi:hypothetical protein